MSEGYFWTYHANEEGSLHSLGELRSFGCLDRQTAARLTWQHHESAYGIIYVEQGIVSWDLDHGESVMTRAGDVICAFPGQFAANRFDVINACRIWWLQLTGPVLEEDWLQISHVECRELCMRLDQMDRVTFVGMRLVEPMRRIQQALAQRDALSLLQTRQGVLDVLLSLILSVQRHDSQEVYGLVERLEHRLQQDWTWRPTVSELASDCGFSPSHYHRLFREYTGLAPLTYMERLRIEHAGRCLLGDGRLRISDLSKTLGYTSSQHFATVFKRLMRVTPTIWQQSGRRIQSSVASSMIDRL